MAETVAPISVEEQLRALATKLAPPERAELARAVVEGLERMRRKYGVLPDSAPGIRDDRDSRG